VPYDHIMINYAYKMIQTYVISSRPIVYFFTVAVNERSACNFRSCELERQKKATAWLS